jgi:hypothetical protein
MTISGIQVRIDFSHPYQAKLSEFFPSPPVQTFLLNFGRDGAGNRPLFYPVNAATL